MDWLSGVSLKHEMSSSSNFPTITMSPYGKSDGQYWEDDDGVEEVEDTDGENEGSCLTAPGVGVEQQGHHHH